MGPLSDGDRAPRMQGTKTMRFLHVASYETSQMLQTETKDTSAVLRTSLSSKQPGPRWELSYNAPEELKNPVMSNLY